MGDAEARMLAALNGLIFACFAITAAIRGKFGIVFAVYCGLSALFWISTGFAGRHELRPLIAAWVLAIGAFLWLQSAKILALSGFGNVMLPFLLVSALPLVYLVLGLIVSVILFREARGRKARRDPSLLEQAGRG